MSHKSTFVLFCLVLGLLLVIKSNFGERLLIRMSGDISVQAASHLADAAVVELHARKLQSIADAPVLDSLAMELKNHENFGIRPYGSKIVSHDTDRTWPPADDFETQALRRFLAAAGNSNLAQAVPVAGEMRFPNGQLMYVSRGDGQRNFRYVQAVVYGPTCLVDCHQGAKTFSHKTREENGNTVPVRPGDLAGAVSIVLPMEQAMREVWRYRLSFLILDQICLSILAWLALR